MFIAAGDRMFLGMQDFEFCPNLIKFYPIYLLHLQLLRHWIRVKLSGNPFKYVFS